MSSSPESRAAAYKDEGNEQFRLKHYRQAIEEYTAGLREGVAKEGVAKEGVGVALRAVLYTNRAAAHFYLGVLMVLLMLVFRHYKHCQETFARV